jgi:hypothetical protein
MNASSSTARSTTPTGRFSNQSSSPFMIAAISRGAPWKSMTQAKRESRKSPESSLPAGSVFTISPARSLTQPWSASLQHAARTGLILGAKRYGRAEQKRKVCLILDIERYRYQKFISDLSGQDVAVHASEPGRAIKAVRDWLNTATPSSIRIPGGRAIAARYEIFREELPRLCAKTNLKPEDLTFSDYILQVEQWLKLDGQIDRWKHDL